MSDTQTIIKRKIQETIARADNYPLLEIITNNLQRAMGSKLRNIFSRPVEAMLDSKEILRFGDYFNTLMFPAILCIFESDRLPGKGLVFMEGCFMENSIEMLLGFPEDRDATREARIPTAIDKKLIMNLIDQCLVELSTCFKNAHADIGEIKFSTIAVETTPQFAMITTEVAPCHVSKFFFDIGEAGYGGRMDIVMPIPMLSPIRRYLEQSFRGDGRGDDSVWKQTIAYAVAKHSITLHSEIDLQHITLNEIYNWKVGDLIDLQAEVPPEISVFYRNEHEEHLLAKGEIGTIKNRKAVKITDEIIQNFSKDLSDVLLRTNVMVKTEDTKKLKFII